MPPAQAKLVGGSGRHATEPVLYHLPGNSSGKVIMDEVNKFKAPYKKGVVVLTQRNFEWFLVSRPKKYKVRYCHCDCDCCQCLCLCHCTCRCNGDCLTGNADGYVGLLVILNCTHPKCTEQALREDKAHATYSDFRDAWKSHGKKVSGVATERA